MAGPPGARSFFNSKLILGNAFFTNEQLELADTNGDGKVDISDATYLQKYLAEYNVALGKQS